MITSLRIITTATPDGKFHIIIDQDDVAKASGFGTVSDLVKRLPKELHLLEVEAVQIHPYQTLVRSYYSGDKTALNKILRSQSGTDFQKSVWRAIASIEYGKTMSYKQLANESGNPAAIRAAGTICGLNRLILLVPCHRVLKSDGGIGSYLYGPTTKESLLRHEGVVS